ncbi:MAG: hypothetical protein H3C47_07475, partial [Candidatus Cloacimonetes bacterium]|nr:hypothetical protein [Candidatus Cloacimonadota bacterium]
MNIILYLSLHSETVLMHGTLSHCQKGETGISFVLRAVTYESQSNSEETRLQQALARLYRQNGALQVHISQEEISKHPHLHCLVENNPFSLAFPALNPLKIKTEVDPETLKISFNQWLEEPSLSSESSNLVFETPEYFIPTPTSAVSLVPLSEPLSLRADPSAY